MTLKLWNFVPSAVGYVIAAVSFTIVWLMTAKDALGGESTVAMAAVPQVVRLLFDVVYWFIVFGFGWPLLRDSTSLLGITFDGILDLPRLGRKKRDA
jgi:hypothetical protein